MDSGYEAVAVDANVATTNGINGTHEEATEMKTRSKVVGGAGAGAGDDESSKPKVRLTRTAMVQKSGVADDKASSSDTEKKDKSAAGGAKSVSKDATANSSDSINSNSSGKVASATPGVGAISTTVAAANAVGASRKTKSSDEDSKASLVVTASTGAGSSSSSSSIPAASSTRKKVALDRDDDSGINSRASSVSNDDIATPARMRTRSSRASEIATTSTPAYKKGGGISGAARVPLSIYEFDAASFDDDLLPSMVSASTSKATIGSSLKRKAVVYIEEMDDENEVADLAPKEGGTMDLAEPVAKRRVFLVTAGVGIVSSLLYPLRALRTGIAAIRPNRATATAPSSNPDDATAKLEGATDGAVAATATAEEFVDSNTQSGSETVAQCSLQQQSGEPATNTCSVM